MGVLGYLTLQVRHKMKRPSSLYLDTFLQHSHPLSYQVFIRKRVASEAYAVTSIYQSPLGSSDSKSLHKLPHICAKVL